MRIHKVFSYIAILLSVIFIFLSLFTWLNYADIKKYQVEQILGVEYLKTSIAEREREINYILYYCKYTLIFSSLILSYFIYILMQNKSK
jgi:hypothetical protein